MTARQDQRHFQKDVVENTRDLRTHKGLTKLRAALEARNVPAGEVLCAGYLESEAGAAVGAVVSKDGTVHEFEFDHDSNELVQFKKVKPGAVETYIDAIHVAIEFRDILFSQLQVSQKNAKKK